MCYVGSYDQNLYALNAGDGTLKWKYTTGSYVYSLGPAVANGVVYFGSWDTNVYALNAGDGSLQVEVHHGCSCPFFAGRSERSGVYRIVGR